MEAKTKKTNVHGTWESIKKFAPYFRNYKRVLIFDLACAFFATAADLAFPRFVGIITGTYLPQHDFTSIVYIALLIILFKAVTVAANYYITKYGHIMGANIEKDLRSKLFRHLESMPHKYFDNVKVGTLMSRITTDLFDITEFAHHCPEEFFIAGVKIIGLLVILLVFHIQYWLLTLCLFAMLPVMVVFAVKYNGKMRRVHKSNRRQMAEINAQCEDTLSGIRVVKSFTNEALEEQKFAVNNERFLEIKKKNYHYMAVFSCGMNFFGAVIYMTIIILGGYLELDAAAFVEYLLYANTLLATIRMIAEYAEQFQRGVTAFERFEEVVGEPADLYDLPRAKDIVSVEGKVEFDGVFFRYSDETDWVLKNLSFYVDKGETLAIVGPSGSGKTTIANLIPRFYDVQKGSVKIDGKDIRELTLHSLRGSIGVVQQDVFLFWGTVADNIAYGKPGATREEVEQAAKLAGAHEFIKALPHGYESYVGERGVKLSGGQKQRISIARVFLKNPPVLILDEATSNLDNESEVVVQRSLDALSRGRTSIVIAHRLSTIRNATKIIVLTEKGVVESGTHAQLIANNGLYKKMYDLSISTASLTGTDE